MKSFSMPQLSLGLIMMWSLCRGGLCKEVVFKR